MKTPEDCWEFSFNAFISCISGSKIWFPGLLQTFLRICSNDCLQCHFGRCWDLQMPCWFQTKPNHDNLNRINGGKISEGIFIFVTNYPTNKRTKYNLFMTSESPNIRIPILQIFVLIYWRGTRKHFLLVENIFWTNEKCFLVPLQ